MNYKSDNSAVVLGLFETGLGVIRSLGREGVKVYGVDFKKDIGYYSRYCSPVILPHPLEETSDFIQALIAFGKQQRHRPALFITSDDFLKAVVDNRQALSEYFLFELPSTDLYYALQDKYKQYQLAIDAGTDVPGTWMFAHPDDLNKVGEVKYYPVILKGVDVIPWRKTFGGSVKGFRCDDQAGLENKIKECIGAGVVSVCQEIIEGPDTNHFKYCAYLDKNKNTIAEFTLKKIRQNPIHFGVGTVVESIIDEKLLQAGRKLFRNINYNGIGSAEFKLDNRDGKLKLIEINPRYWQQNSLTTACGVNFAYLNYLKLTGNEVLPVTEFATGIKWVNIYSDFESFSGYRKEGTLSWGAWLKSLRGKKILSDIALDDIIPAFYEYQFGKRIIRIPAYLWRKLIRDKSGK